MQFKHLFLCFCLGATTIGSAHNSFKASHPIFPVTPDGVCTIPPPTNFHEEEIGTDFVRLAWDVGSAANSIRIRAFRASDHFLISTTDVPPGITTVTISGLPSETELSFEARYVSNKDGSEGEVATKNLFSVILDLIVIGYQPGNYQSFTCPLFAPGACQFPNNYPGQTTPFLVRKNGAPSSSRVFGMQRSGGRFHALLFESNQNDASEFKFKCNGFDPIPNSCFGPISLEIWHHPANGSPSRIAQFTASSVNNAINNLIFSELTEGFQVYRIVESPFGGPPDPGEERSTSVPSIGQPATVSPNPFSNNLDIYLAQNTAEQVSLQLYNLAGQKVLDQQFPGDQEQYSLSTASLSPGFYMLRIEANGEVQTLKVVKSE